MRVLGTTADTRVHLQDRSCQCLLAMLSDDPSLQRQRDVAEPAGIAVLLRDGHVVVASVAGGSHVLSLGGSPKLQPCKWTHVAVSFEGLTFGSAGGLGVTTCQVRPARTGACGAMRHARATLLQPSSHTPVSSLISPHPQPSHDNVSSSRHLHG